MQKNNLKWVIGLSFFAGLITAIVLPAISSAAPDSSPAKNKNPLQGMTPVEASKGLELPQGNDEAAVVQGRYLVGLLGCASCHTEGALIGKPDPAKTLAGSSIGIAYSNPMVNNFPGAVYPPNLTPDKETGLGEWSLEEIVTLLRSGKTRHGRQTMAIMPWTSYAQLNESDARAIASYLKSLEPVKNKVPKQVLPGNPAKTPLVHVGLYRSR
ncbi:c-type cytochrome [Congregibacter variabilis]|uniref:C-type cytochrome n=1 Tax=Congregibacter variabilis TaxID=3081200 RepID=A0ABZ0I8E0_9GAMM|nr:c-type cytochrome [Congregibacter sp. IMCC43200]